ncbi:hypothetical protein SAY86_021318 [Trapa natans]|uniref:Glutaredoxin-like protein n=1 Tax=Trapa natans TaxID=22666 RepID=A0AAN7MBC4_TRANT|nr:hypothetical protein SAY86_021318 [Trapa natans]
MTKNRPVREISNPVRSGLKDGSDEFRILHLRIGKRLIEVVQSLLAGGGGGMALAAVAVAARPSSGSLWLLTRQVRPRYTFASSVFASFSNSSSSSVTRKLVLYSKPGCCLCHGLKEKLQAAEHGTE